MEKGARKLNWKHYAWVICFGCALMFYATCGLGCNVFSVYSPFIRKQWDFSNSQISLIGTFRSLFQMVAIFLAGRIYGKIKVRTGMLIAGIVCALGYVTYGLAAVFPVYLAGSALVGFGYGLTSMVAISILINRWFVKNRTLAVSMVSATSGLATLGVPSLITYNIQHHGMMYAFLLEGAVMAALVVTAFLILRETPEEMGTLPFGAEKLPEKNAPEAAAEEGTPEIPVISEPGMYRHVKEPHVKDLNVLLIYVMIILGCSFNSGGFGAISMLSTTEGYDSAITAVAISAAGTMLMVGKLVFGAMSTRLSLYKTSLIFAALTVISTLSMCFIRVSPVVLLCGTGMYGFSLTLLSIGPVTWTEDWFPADERLEMIRRSQLSYSIGSLLNSMLPGIMADLFGGSYVPFYVYSTVCAVIVAVLLVYTYKSVRWY